MKKRKVYVVCEEVDLGYHIDSIWTSKERAEKECKYLNKEHREKLERSLEKSLEYWHPNDQEYREKYKKKFFEQEYEDKYFIEEEYLYEDEAADS